MLGSKFVKFLMPILKLQVNSSSDFSSFFSVITYNSSVNFKFTHFVLWTKGSHENTNFDIFKCSDENLLNSSCHFWKHKSVFLQMLHQYSVPSNKTPLYFFSSNIIYFVQKKPIKVQNFEIFECSGQNSWNSSCQSWSDKSVLLQILQHSPLLWQIIPLDTFLTLDKSIPSRSQFGDFQGLWWKFAKLLMSVFGNTSQFSFKVCTNLECN